MSRAIRSTTLVLTLLVLCSSATYARPSAGWPISEAFLVEAWDRVIAWFLSEAPASPGGSNGFFGEKEGSSMDPNGVSVPASALCDSQIERSGNMDDNGNK